MMMRMLQQYGTAMVVIAIMNTIWRVNLMAWFYDARINTNAACDAALASGDDMMMWIRKAAGWLSYLFMAMLVVGVCVPLATRPTLEVTVSKVAPLGNLAQRMGGVAGKKHFTAGFGVGFLIFGLYSSFNLSFLEPYDVPLAAVETLWGALVFGVATLFVSKAAASMPMEDTNRLVQEEIVTDENGNVELVEVEEIDVPPTEAERIAAEDAAAEDNQEQEEEEANDIALTDEEIRARQRLDQAYQERMRLQDQLLGRKEAELRQQARIDEADAILQRRAELERERLNNSTLPIDTPAIDEGYVPGVSVDVNARGLSRNRRTSYAYGRGRRTGGSRKRVITRSLKNRAGAYPTFSVRSRKGKVIRRYVTRK